MKIYIYTRYMQGTALLMFKDYQAAAMAFDFTKSFGLWFKHI